MANFFGGGVVKMTYQELDVAGLIHQASYSSASFKKVTETKMGGSNNVASSKKGQEGKPLTKPLTGSEFFKLLIGKVRKKFKKAIGFKLVSKKKVGSKPAYVYTVTPKETFFSVFHQ